MDTYFRKIGSWYNPTNSEFTVWAPHRNKMELAPELPGHGAFQMEKSDDGYWHISLPLPPGTLYRFRLDGQAAYPDPASFSQPQGVHGPSELADRLSFPWTDGGWEGVPLSNMIIYELHTGAFSSTHDFEGIIQRLDHLLQLGINTIELMPLGQFPGNRNWGYDGVYPFAIQNSYGGIAGFKQLVDAAHARDIAVLVDVVYNHLGPEGNYLPEYGPYFTDKYLLPWGKALNFDGPGSDGVRNYFLENARMWLEDYHADGLRLDAVHAIYDFSAVHFMQQLKECVTEIGHRTGRKKVLIAEIDLNDPRYINPPERGGYGLDGQWIDEFHHSLRSLLTGEKKAYYEDFGDIAQLEKAFRQTYVYDGNYSIHRRRHFGGRADGNPYSQFVVFAQNHDQVGNRALGDRLTGNLDMEQLKLVAAAVLLSPYVPLLFMGEEYGEKNPFPFFVDFSDPTLIEGVRKGRAAEFPEFSRNHDLPDPMAPETFESSILSWDDQSTSGSALLSYYRQLIGMRKTRPALQGRTRDCMVVHPAKGTVIPLERKILNDRIFIWLHFGDQPATLENTTGEHLHKILDSASPQWRGPGELAARNLSPGNILCIAPYSVVIFEIKG